ncbi:hypothetical protein M405DRAFT_931172 [Rhizopogon salebrosus TDB-379]|nr:hypothetical protein M405DRAFT_931172 [Rhizopogon salebrosus TDB-379]
MSTALDLSDNATFFDDNIVVVEIDNLLCGWPTYTIDLTLQRPGPLKLVLRLKDASPLKRLEDTDSDDESEGSLAKSLHDSPTLSKDSDVTMVDDHDATDMSQHFSANPVVLHGIIKDSPAVSALRKKLADDDGYVWPPRRSFKQISPKLPTTSIDRIKVLPAMVAALKID